MSLVMVYFHGAVQTNVVLTFIHLFITMPFQGHQYNVTMCPVLHQHSEERSGKRGEGVERSISAGSRNTAIDTDVKTDNNIVALHIAAPWHVVQAGHGDIPYRKRLFNTMRPCPPSTTYVHSLALC